MGDDFESHERLLRTFSCYVGEGLHISQVRPDRVTAFLAGSGPVTRYWLPKHKVLRGFYRYAFSRGYFWASPLPTAVPKQPERFRPHIHAMDELSRLPDGTASYSNALSN
jgi:hypothetical protein